MHYEYIRNDALVADVLSSSPHIVDLYGYCGLTTVWEYFPYGDIQSMILVDDDDKGTSTTSSEEEIELEKEQEGESKKMKKSSLRRNASLDGDDNEDTTTESHQRLSSAEKLSIALQMAEGLAALHGYPGGVIVHQDIQLHQYLWNGDHTAVKLNDFNRAELMLYDEFQESYCKYFEGNGYGIVSIFWVGL